MTNRVEMIDLLTGVKSSKRSYYTELKKTVFELQKKNMQLEIINEVTKSFNIETSIDTLLHNILDKLNQIFSVERLYISVVDKDELILTNVYPKNTLTIQPSTCFPHQNSLFRSVLEKKQPLIKRLDAKEDSFFEAQTLTQLESKCILLYPLVSKGKVIGVFCFENKEEVEYEKSDYLFFQQLSDQLAACLENARLYHAVLTSKKEWEETFRSVPSMIFIVDENEQITLFNDAVRKFFSVDDRSIGKKTFHQLLEINKLDSPLTETYQTKKTTFRQLTIQNRICELECFPSLNEENELTEVMIYMNDVTEKLQIEAQLIHSGKLAAIGEMAAGVAHELNNPLTAVLGNSQLLLRTTERETSEYKLLQDIHQ